MVTSSALKGTGHTSASSSGSSGSNVNGSSEGGGGKGKGKDGSHDQHWSLTEDPMTRAARFLFQSVQVPLQPQDEAAEDKTDKQGTGKVEAAEDETDKQGTGKDGTRTRKPFEGGYRFGDVTRSAMSAMMGSSPSSSSVDKSSDANNDEGEEDLLQKVRRMSIGGVNASGYGEQYAKVEQQLQDCIAYLEHDCLSKEVAAWLTGQFTRRETALRAAVRAHFAESQVQARISNSESENQSDMAVDAKDGSGSGETPPEKIKTIPAEGFGERTPKGTVSVINIQQICATYASGHMSMEVKGSLNGRGKVTESEFWSCGESEHQKFTERCVILPTRMYPIFLSFLFPLFSLTPLSLFA